jgi:hypothetical protein
VVVKEASAFESSSSGRHCFSTLPDSKTDDAHAEFVMQIAALL